MLDRPFVWILVSALPLTALACGGSQPAAQTAAEGQTSDAPATETAPSTSAASTSAAPAAEQPKKDDSGEGWEGEGEARGAGDSKGDAAKGASGKPAEGSALPEGGKPGAETRTMQVIQQVVKDNRKPVRKCYDDARKDLPTLTGDMVIHFVIDPKGKVQKAELNRDKSTLKSPAVVDCAIEAIKKIQFPPSSRGMDTEVNYPYNFKPDGGG